MGTGGVTGICFAGRFMDKPGRRPGFAVMLLQATIFVTWWIFATDQATLFRAGIVWGWGFPGVRGPITTYTAEMFPTRIRGVGNRFSWTIGMFRGYVPWPFVSVYPRETTGLFQAAFLLIPAIMIIQALIVWFHGPKHAEGAGRDLSLMGASNSDEARARERRGPHPSRHAALPGGRKWCAALTLSL